MGVRVRIRIIHGDKTAITSALVNSGFESNEPDICIPLGLAKRLKLWPSTVMKSINALTAGGEVALHLLGKVRLQLLAGSEVKEDIECNALLNTQVDEVLLSDYVIDELGIVVISFRKGLWRHKSDPPSTIRQSAPPEYW
ncbi:MAG: hypothetical protein DRZ82_03045 [Thermoprotei archaeon]|nr:MAG: hypothetical protein DRZ82_03045 [Thermoprotei archaeon]